jgi:hypothetical protein
MAAQAAGPRWLALIEVKLSALDDTALHLGAADGATLKRCAMPYEVPIEPTDTSIAG